jgi:predicted RNA-binding protein with PUA-like domain
MNYWLIKSEPFKYSWSTFLKDQITFWDGVRNYQARNNLREMRVGEMCLFYHSNEDKQVVGIAEIVKEFYQDPTTDDTNWVVVDVKPVNTLLKPVTLNQIKTDPRLNNIGMIKQPRLSVIKITQLEFNTILELSNEN